MRKPLGTYMVVIPKSPHIKHTFDTFAQAEGWMHNAGCTGYICYVVGRVVTKTETQTALQEIVQFIEAKATQEAGQDNG